MMPLSRGESRCVSGPRPWLPSDNSQEMAERVGSAPDSTVLGRLLSQKTRAIAPAAANKVGTKAGSQEVFIVPLF